MKEILVLLCLVSGFLGGPHFGWGHHQESCGDANDDKYHIAGQKARLDDLKEELHDFKDKVNSRIEKGTEYSGDIDKLKKRIAHLEPSGCNDKTELQCGGEKPKCLSRLLVCDGDNDCHNGYDEEECETYTPSGSVWIGTFIYDHCTQRRPEKIRLSINNYKVIDYFRSFPEVTATLEFDQHKHDSDIPSLEMIGHMDRHPGDHVLRFEPPEGDGLSLLCIFDGEHNDHCHGEIVHRDDGEICAEFLLELREH